MPSTTTSPSAVTVGHALKQARAAMGLTLKQVSESMGIAMSTISEIESGKRRISAVELYRFAKLYQRPISFFLEETEPSASFAILMRAAGTASVSKETIINFHELSRSYRDLRKLVRAPEMPSPSNYSTSRLTTLGHAEELAEAERGSLGLNGQPIKDICDLLEGKRGIKIFHLPADPERFSGAFTYDEQLGACFLINSQHPKRRRTFTVAHEYAHCIAHRNQLAHIDTCPAFEIKNPRERFANAFAASFLMPKRAVNEVLGQLVFPQRSALTAEVLVHLAMYFGVSSEAMGWRLVSLRRLSLSRWRDLLSQQVPSSPTARLLGYCVEEEPPDTVPRQYKYLAYKAYEMKLISFEKLAELLQRNYYELREEFRQASQEGDE
ncbi:MAG: ImmA/IrrE family metallo-endopeptidase [Dehalococcoidia bacterium]|nr:MAG: ImmA/IrrE family metallo-endopeptidase [Dehalococcoidia bacterium]